MASFKRFFSHHSHSGHHRSQNPHSESSEDFRRAYSADNDDHSNRHPDDTNEQSDTVEPFIPINSSAFATEQQQYRTRRRSSVQILDKKLIQSLSNQTTSSITTGTDSNVLPSTSEDLCEL
jgi:hypothetical protein